MHQKHFNKRINLFGTVCGSLLLGLPAIVQPASAQVEAEPLNPCPQIYYEEPFDSSTLVPEGCPLNTISRQLGINQQTAPTGSTLGNPDQVITSQSAPPSPGIYDRAPYTSTPGGNLPGAPLTPNTISPADAPTTPAQTGAAPAPLQPPLPEQRSEPVAMVMPTNGTIDMQVTNNTNTAVYYQVLGEAALTERRMLMGGESTVLRNLPTPLTLTAERADDGFLEFMPMASQAGMLEVSLDEDDTPLDSNEGVLRVQENGQVLLN